MQNLYKTAVKGLLTVAIVASSIAASPQVRGAESPKNSTLSIAIVQCPQEFRINAARSIAVRLFRLPISPGAVQTIEQRVILAGGQRSAMVRLNLTAGRYVVGMIEGVCTGNIVVRVLAERGRSVATMLRAGAATGRTGASLAGSLPIPGIRAVRFKPFDCTNDSCVVNGTVEGSAYYFDRIHTLRGSLEISFYGVDQPDSIPVNILGANQNATLDIHLDALKPLARQ